MNSKVGDHEHFIGWKSKPKSRSPRLNRSQNLNNSQNLNKSQNLSSSQSMKSERQLKTGEFKIMHYAGEVVYKIEGFLQKNKDTLIPDCVSALQKSKNALIKELFPVNNTQANRSFQTAASKFRTSLSLLIEALSQCVPHYIRCIKPNERKRALDVNEERIRHQIRYLGLMENVRVRRAGTNFFFFLFFIYLFFFLKRILLENRL
jgi:myosin I